MKKVLFIIIAILISITVDAQKWYVATTGNDASGNGTALRPWLTVKHAADTIKSENGFAGDTIILGIGTFSEPAQIVLSDSISLMGAGVTSIITTANALDPIILAQSTSEGTSATQSISYIKFDGNSYTAVRGVAIWKRSNVIVHHCTFEDFLSQGISFRGQHNSTGGPTTYSTGNKFHDNIIYDCSRYTTYGTGCLEIGGQSGMLVYNDTIMVIDRGGTSHGYGIKGTADGWNKGLKIYDNVITVPEFENTGYNFAIELWTQRGGIEIYNNTIKGAIDIGGWDTYDDGGYGFALKIYENTIGYDANQTYSTSGIYLEPAVRQGIYIYRNYFKNMKYGIRLNHFTGDLIPGMDDIYIYYNIFYNLREVAAGLTGFGIVSYTADGGYQAPLRNLNILNNVFYNPTAGTMSTVIWVRGLPEVSDIQIRNNIIYNTYNGITFANSTVNGLDINNNIFFNATNADILFQSTTVSDSSTTENLTSDPQWVGGSPYSYKLQATSPARDAGLSVGLTSDYGGYSVPIGALPDIGAWEYGADVDPPNWTEQGIGWDRMQKKVNFRDTVNFTRGFMIAGVPISSSGSGLEILGGLTASVDDLNNTSGSTGNLQGQINAIKASTVDDSKADTSLSNLSSVAINTHLLPDTAGTINLGSGAKPFGKIFGTATQISSLMVGDSTSNTIAKFDSVAVFNDKLYAFIAGDTVGWGILTADSEDITDHVIMLTDTAHTNGKHILYTQWQVDSIFAGFTSGFDSVYIYAKVDSLINVVGEQQSQIDLLWAAIDSLNLGDFNPPSFFSAEVGTFNDSILVVILNDTDVQQDSIPAVGAFTVKENGVAMGIEEIDIGNDTVYISLDALAIEGYTYTVSYNKDFDYPQLQDSSENITPSWTKRTVTNNVFDAFPSIVSVTETLTNSTDRTSHPITMPATVEEGDLLLVFFATDATSDTDPVSIDTDNSDDGWTNANPSITGGSMIATVFWKIADSDGDTLTVLTNNAQISGSQTYRITNFEPANPLDIVYGSSTVTEFPDPPAATGDYSADDYLWIVFYGADGYTSYATAAPADFTGLETTYVETAGSCSINSAYRKYNINGSYNPGTFTSNVADEASQTYTVIINPIQ